MKDFENRLLLASHEYSSITSKTRKTSILSKKVLCKCSLNAKAFD